MSKYISQSFVLFVAPAEQIEHPQEVLSIVCFLSASSIIIWTLEPPTPPERPHCLNWGLDQPSKT